MLRVMLLSCLLSTCAAQPSFAKVLPGKWDGTCEFISEAEDDKYHHQNPEEWVPFQSGYIPPDKAPDNSDIPCLPEIHMGPK